jgi:hypothetical protein
MPFWDRLYSGLYDEEPRAVVADLLGDEAVGSEFY